jgi:ferric-dicitrate binding protein FerR (iron transport regulator)/tetratricopeptide (TPR) repeat protein
MGNDPTPQGAPERDIATHNIERLLTEAYQPETLPAEYVRGVQELLLATAREQAQARQPAPAGGGKPAAPSPVRFRWGRAYGVAAALAGLALVWHAWNTDSNFQPRDPAGKTLSARSTTVRIGPAGDGQVTGLVPRPRPPAPAGRPLAVGDALQTRARERVRRILPDGSVLYVNENSALRVDAERRVTLSRGEVFVEVAPRTDGTRQAVFQVATAQRQVSALGTKFAVRADQAGTGVLVTQGRVQVSGQAGVVSAGQELPPDAGRSGPRLAARASHVLEWTRDLMAAAESPLVPASKHAGGALVAIDPQGQEAQLSLRKFHIDVHIEDGFARTTIDQTYFNHNPWRMEGTFYFPLPPDASLSRLAMYVDGNLREGGMDEREHARTVYESIVYSQRDPALLEWVDGSTFKMRVFPLEGRQEKRIILSYSQRLATLYGTTRYRFPTGHSMSLVDNWSFHARVKGGAGLKWNSPSHALVERRDGADLVLDARARNVKPERDVALELDDPRGAAAALARFAIGRHQDQKGQTEAQYLMLRYRPSLTAAPRRERRDWVFLFESSGDRSPLLARAQVEVVRTMLANAEHDDTFTILTAGTRRRAFGKERVPATPDNIQAAVAFLDRTHLIGALDLGKALDDALGLLKNAGNPHLVHVGSGIPVLGERRQHELTQRIPDRVQYVGVGVGKRWARNFMKAAAERTGGYFTQINPDEPLAWRTFDLMATLNTPRLLGISVADDAGKVHFLSHEASLAQGEELCAIARFAADGKDLPRWVTVRGKLEGQPVTMRLPVEVDPGTREAAYLPRTWARLEIDRLLAENGEKHKKKIVELSKAMYVMSPFTSLLVLENDAMHKQFQVDGGRKDHWALYNCPRKIKVEYEPLPGDSGGTPGGAQSAQPTAELVLKTILVRVPPRVLTWGNQGGDPYNGQIVFSAHDLYAGAFAVSALGTRVQSWFDREVDFLGDDSSSPSREKDKKAGRKGASPEEVHLLIPGLRTVEGRNRSGWAWLGNLNGRPGPLMGGQFLGGIGGAGGLSGLAGFAGGGMGDSDFRRAVPFPIQMEVEEQKKQNQQPFALGEPFLKMYKVPAGNAKGIANSLKRTFDTSTGLTVAAIDGTSIAVWGSPLDHTEISRQLGGGYLTTFGEWNRLQLPALAFSPDGRRLATGDNETIRLWTTTRRDLGFVNGLIATNTDTGLVDRLGPNAVLDGNVGWRGLVSSQSLLYQRPHFHWNWRQDNDLAGYAPGLNTTATDIRAVLEAELGRDSRQKTGTVEPAARALIDRSRQSGWRALAITPGTEQSPFQVVFDGAGRFTIDRILANGLRELTVCEGKTLWHLYPELAIGARRTLSRFHRAELTALLPWILPPAEDLAHGMDLRCVGPRTVALVPLSAPGAGERRKAAPSWQLHLFFAPDGRLAERRLVEMPAKKTFYRETYDEAGLVKFGFETEGKGWAEIKLTLRKAAPPNLKPDLTRLVVVPMPLRTRDHILRTAGKDVPYDKLEAATAIALIATDSFTQNGWTAHEVFARRFHTRGDRRLGFYTLLASSGIHLDPKVPCNWKNLEVRFDIQGEHPREPLAQFLAKHNHRLHDAKHNPVAPLGGPTDGFVQQLAAFRQVYGRWLLGKAPQDDGAEARAQRERDLAVVRRCKSPLLRWELLDVIQRYYNGGDTRFRRALGDAYRLFKNDADLGYAARYEYASSFVNTDKAQARKLFRELHAEALKEGWLPPIDGSFYQAFHPATTGDSGWVELMRQTAATLVAGQRRAAVIALARQCYEVGDQTLADQLFTRALAGGRGKDRNRLALLGLQYWWYTQRFAQAEALLQTLLADKELARQSLLWRLAAFLAEQRGKVARSVTYLEKALELEYRHLPPVINLQAVRAEYGTLLGHYQSLAAASTLLEKEPPHELLAKVVRAADRWRSLDPDGTAACQAAARIFQTVGADDLAWDYHTTPLSQRPNEADPWWNLARQMSQEGEFALADKAYAEAFEAEPTNAQILWDRAMLLEQTGKTERARQLYRQIADGQWQPRFAWLQRQARQMLR